MSGRGRAGLLALAVCLAAACSSSDNHASESYRHDASGKDCVFRGPYRLSVELSAGNSALVYDVDRGAPMPFGSDLPLLGCRAGAGGTAMTQTTDEAACSLVACLGDECLELECERANPVVSCAASESYQRTFSCGCASPTSWRIDVTTHALNPAAVCPASCITEMQCEYSWELIAEAVGG